MNEYIDFYIQYKGHPKFKDTELIEDDIIRVIVQKYEMICGTNKGDVFGDYDFGSDLELLLHQTSVSSKYVEEILHEQIYKYLPEVVNVGYTLKAEFVENLADGSHALIIQFTVNGYEIYTHIN